MKKLKEFIIRSNQFYDSNSNNSTHMLIFLVVLLFIHPYALFITGSIVVAWRMLYSIIK